MRRVIWTSIVLVLAFGIYVARPPLSPPSGTGAVEGVSAPAVGCVVSVGRGESGSLVFGGAKQMIGFEADIESGFGAVALEDITPSGVGSALVELDGPGGATVVIGGDISSMVANCSRSVGGSMVLTGISTANGRDVELVVANPYALDAVIDVQTISEVGADTAGELESLVVPAGGVAVRELSRILPLRSHLSIVLTPRQGTVHAVAFEASETDARAIEGVPGNDEWWVLLPPEEGVARNVTIVPAEPGTVAFQIDTWSPEGAVEAAFDDVVPSGGQIDLTDEDIGTATVMRIITANPSVVGIAIDGEGTVAGGPAVRGVSTRWLLAGAGSLPGTTLVRVFNPQQDRISVVLRPLDGSPELRVEVPGSALREIELTREGPGFILEAGAPVAAAWLTSGVGLTYASGVPLDG